MKIKKSIKKLVCSLLIVGTLMTTTAVVASAKETDTALASTQSSITEIQSNYGDNDEDRNQSMYHVGDVVEVYNTPLHLTTRQRTIVECKYEEGGLIFKHHLWTYRLAVNGITDSEKEWVAAGDIQH